MSVMKLIRFFGVHMELTFKLFWELRVLRRFIESFCLLTAVMQNCGCYTKLLTLTDGLMTFRGVSKMDTLFSFLSFLFFYFFLFFSFISFFSSFDELLVSGILIFYTQSVCQTSCPISASNLTISFISESP